LSVEEICCLSGSKITKLSLPATSYTVSDWKKLKQALPSTKLSMNRHDSDIDPSLLAPLH
jgi:hypothetical protein